MSHARLVSIRLRHDYYRDGVCHGLTLLPTAATQRLLRNHRCVVRGWPGGIDVGVETAAGGEPKVAFASPPVLAFELLAGDPDFALFTDTARVPAGAGFTVGEPPAIEPTHFALSPTKPQRFAQLSVDCPVGASALELSVDFSARSLRWYCYLLTNQHTADFAVVADGRPGLVWQPVTGDDPVSRRLAGEYPGLRRLCFVSSVPIPCREAGIGQVRLCCAGETIIDNLPNPEWRNRLFALDDTAATGAVFQIVTYVTNHTLTKV